MSIDKVALKNLSIRHFKGKLLQYFTLCSVLLVLGFLTIFLIDIFNKGYLAFIKVEIQVPFDFAKNKIDIPAKTLSDRAYRKLISKSFLRQMPKMLEDHPDMINSKQDLWVLADDQVDQYMKGKHHTLKSKDKKLIDQLQSEGKVRKVFNDLFFLNGDSKLPEFAGIYSAIIGTILTMTITMLISMLLGIMTAIYLEEFTKDSLTSNIIEICINNLAAVPSIIFGLLGLSVLINIWGMPRSSALVGGLTLALMILPIIIVGTRSALRAVPSSIKEAGFALGLTKVQIIQHHILPIAMPSILTSFIIGLAQAIGETAPLIIVGMVAFIPQASSSFVDAATVLPAQIFTWAGSPERLYIEKTAAAIIVLLVVLVLLNAAAIYLRKKTQKQF